MSLSRIVYDFQGVCMLTSFFVSLRLIGAKYTPEYMRGFFLYPTVGVVILIPHMLGTHKIISSLGYSNVLNNLAIIFHFYFLSNFIIKVMKLDKYIYRFTIFQILTCLILLFLLCTRYSLTIVNKPAMALANLSLCIFCVYYYYNLFNNIPIKNLKDSASFWIITGIFTCMSMVVPIYASFDYVNSLELKMNVLYPLTTLPFALLHIFFIKGILVALNKNPHSV